MTFVLFWCAAQINQLHCANKSLMCDVIIFVGDRDGDDDGDVMCCTYLCYRNVVDVKESLQAV